MNANNPSELAPVTVLQEDVDQWIQTFGVRYFNELTNMAQLTEEVGEVARIIARRYGEQSEKESDKNKDLGEELADVLFVVLCLANQTGTDLQAAYNRRMEAKGARDKDRHALMTNSPLCSRSKKAAAIAPTPGSICCETRPDRPASSHAAIMISNGR